MTSFGERLRATFDNAGHLCVGIDPHSFLLTEWGLTDDPAGLREFGLRVVDAAAPLVGIVKPQVAFFERHGSALTVSPFLGIGSVAGPRSIALEHGKGLFVLAATSNPEAGPVQLARAPSGTTVAAGIVEQVQHWNAAEPALGSVGLVLGATVSLDDYGIGTDQLRDTPVLAPGFGHQGAAFTDIPQLFGTAAAQLVVSASRSILAAGPDRISTAIEEQAARVAEAIAA
jgi:orotidine-5'-phosphate decarboxylase